MQIELQNKSGEYTPLKKKFTPTKIYPEPKTPFSGNSVLSEDQIFTSKAIQKPSTFKSQADPIQIEPPDIESESNFLLGRRNFSRKMRRRVKKRGKSRKKQGNVGILC